MPYDTPYNRMIAQRRNASNRAYSDIHAYSNQMANGRGKFDEARICFPDRDGTTLYNTAQIVNPDDMRREGRFDGGITHKNLEGSGGVLHETFRNIGKGVDQKLAGIHRLFRVPERPCNMADSDSSSSSDSEMEGEGIFDDLVSGAKSMGANFLEDPAKYIDYGKKAYDFAKPIFGRGSMSDLALGNHKSAESSGRGMAGGNENLVINPFASPKEQAVFRNYEMTSGPIGGAKCGNGISGGKRAPSAWIQHVKAYAASKGMKYRDALRCPLCKASYHKGGKGVSGGSVIGGPINDPVNRGKITGLGRKTGSALFAPKGQFELSAKTTNMDDAMSGGASTEFPQNFMKSTGHKWEGATLGAGISGAGPFSCFKRNKKVKMAELTPEQVYEMTVGGTPRKAWDEPHENIVEKDGMLMQNIPVKKQGNEVKYVQKKDPEYMKTTSFSAPAEPIYAVSKKKIDRTSKPTGLVMNDIAMGMPAKRRRGKGATDFPIITPATIRRIRKETGAGQEGKGIIGDLLKKTGITKRFQNFLNSGLKKGLDVGKIQYNHGVNANQAHDIYNRQKRGRGARFGSNPNTYTPKNLVASGQSGGMLKQLMKSSSISGGKKVAAVQPNDYPANANIHGFGQMSKAKLRGMHVKRIMEKHKCSMPDASKLYTKMCKHVEGKGFFDDLWSGVKDVGSTALNILPAVLPHILGSGQSGGKAKCVTRIMEKHNLPKTEATKLYTKMCKHVEGKGFFDDLWSGVKDVGSTALNILPAVLPHILGSGQSGGKRITPEHRLQCITRIMEKHSVPKTKATKMLTEMRKTGGAWYDDLWTGFKMPFQAAAKIAPAVLPFIL